MPNPTTPIPGLIGLLGQQILGAIVVDVEKRLAIFVDRGDFQACLDLEYGNPVEQDASVCVDDIRPTQQPSNNNALLRCMNKSVGLLPGIFDVETCQ
jgi:hypothetical protein